MWDVLHVMSNVTGITGNLCNKCPKWLVEQISSYSDYFNAISGFTLNSRAPGGPVTLVVSKREELEELLCENTRMVPVVTEHVSILLWIQKEIISHFSSFCCDLVLICYYQPQRSWNKVKFSQASVILLLGGSAARGMVWSRHPPGAENPPEQTPQSRHPPEQTPPWEQTPPRADTPTGAEHPPGADTPVAIWVRMTLSAK